MSGRADPLSVMDALSDLARHRLTMKRRHHDRAVASGKCPHWLETVKTERAEYLVEQAKQARADVAALADAGQRTTAAFRALGEATPRTREADRARHECEVAMLALDAALAPFGDKT